MASDALELHDIDALYGDSHVLHGVSLRLGEGRLLGLLGRNGAGKSTSMSVTVGLLPPRHGSVAVFGRTVTGRAPEAIAAQGVALVPQGRRIFRSLTVRENLLVAARKPRAGASTVWTLDAVYGLFPRIGERRRQVAGSLSGGEQQMCAMARALMAEPKLLMVDEMSLGLAPVIVDQLLTVLAEIRKEGVTVLLIEQDVFAAFSVADRAYVMETGRIVKEGPVKALETDPELRRAYLGVA